MLILGAGGAARAIAFEAARRGAHVIVSSRTGSAARNLAREFGVDWVPLGKIRDVDAEILVNATPVGMAPRTRESPFPSSMLKGRTVFDAVYNPPMTRLLREAAGAGAKIVRGTEMYVNQAAMQFALYSGIRPSVPLMKKLLTEVEAEP